MRLKNQYPSLRDKTVLITGGASGIGAGLVEAFCQQHAKVIFIDIDKNTAHLLLNQLKESPDITQPSFYFCDVTDTKTLQKIITQASREHGKIKVLINNAANDQRHSFKNVNEAYWDERISVNLKHYFFAIQSVCNDMKELGGGSIINLGSGSWRNCQDQLTGYTTAKAGIEGLTRGLAKELGADNIRINTLIPGWVMTDRQKREFIGEDTTKIIARNQCLTNPLLPEDICAMALFLASDDSKMCTSQNFIVDGGWT